MDLLRFTTIAMADVTGSKEHIWHRLSQTCETCQLSELNATVSVVGGGKIISTFSTLYQSAQCSKAAKDCIEKFFLVLDQKGVICKISELTLAIVAFSENEKSVSTTAVKAVLGILQQNIPVDYTGLSFEIWLAFTQANLRCGLTTTNLHQHGNIAAYSEALLKAHFHATTLRCLLEGKEEIPSEFAKEIRAKEFGSTLSFLKEFMTFISQTDKKLRQLINMLVSLTTTVLVRKFQGGLDTNCPKGSPHLLTLWLRSISLQCPQALPIIMHIYQVSDAVPLMLDATQHSSSYRETLNKIVEDNSSGDLLLSIAKIDVDSLDKPRLQSLWEYFLFQDIDNARLPAFIEVVVTKCRVQGAQDVVSTLCQALANGTPQDGKESINTQAILLAPWDSLIGNHAMLNSILREISSTSESIAKELFKHFSAKSNLTLQGLSCLLEEICRNLFLSLDEQNATCIAEWLESIHQTFAIQFLKCIKKKRFTGLSPISIHAASQALDGLMKLQIRHRTFIVPDVWKWVDNNSSQEFYFLETLQSFEECTTILSQETTGHETAVDVMLGTSLLLIRHWMCCSIDARTGTNQLPDLLYDVLNAVKQLAATRLESLPESHFLSKELEHTELALPKEFTLRPPKKLSRKHMKRILDDGVQVSARVRYQDIMQWVLVDMESSGSDDKSSLREIIVSLCETYAQQNKHVINVRGSDTSRVLPGMDELVKVRDFYMQDISLQSSQEVLGYLCSVFGEEFVLVVLVRAIEVLGEGLESENSDVIVRAILSLVARGVISCIRARKNPAIEAIVMLLSESLRTFRTQVHSTEGSDCVVAVLRFLDSHYNLLEEESKAAVAANVTKLWKKRDESWSFQLTLEATALAQRITLEIPLLSELFPVEGLSESDLAQISKALEDTNAFTHVTSLRNHFADIALKYQSIPLCTVLAQRTTKSSRCLIPVLESLLMNRPHISSWTNEFFTLLSTILHNTNVALSPTVYGLIHTTLHEKIISLGKHNSLVDLPPQVQPLLHILIVARKESIAPFLPVISTTINALLTRALVFQEKESWTSLLRLYRDVSKIQGVSFEDVRSMLINLFTVLYKFDVVVRKRVRDVALGIDGLLDLYFQQTTETLSLQQSSNGNASLLTEILSAYRLMRPKD
eukprot:PhF_6_TR31537/c0_g1_i1/m.46517